MNALDKSLDLRQRTKSYAIRIVRLYRSLPHSSDAQVLGKQLLRSGTSVAANYRAACRARSRAEFISKTSIVLEEADETAFWIELTERAGLLPPNKLIKLKTEAEELTKIFNATRTTARNHKS